MPHFLFIAEIPPNDATSTERVYTATWRNFAQEAEASTKNMKGAKQLREGSWLLPLDGSWHVLHELANAATKSTIPIPYTILLIEGEVTSLTDIDKPSSAKVSPLRI